RYGRWRGRGFRCAFVQLLLNALDARLKIGRGASHRLFDLGCRAFDFALQSAKLIKLHLAVDVGLDIADVALQSSKQMPEHARSLGQPFRPDDDQSDDGDDDDFGEAYIEHGMRPIRAGSALAPLWIDEPGKRAAGGRQRNCALTLFAKAPCALLLRWSCRKLAAAARPAVFQRRFRCSSCPP